MNASTEPTRVAMNASEGGAGENALSARLPAKLVVSGTVCRLVPWPGCIEGNELLPKI
ncbi:hypothetical protein BDB13_6088 [Rhodococcus sp. OK302]|nr:hypothetical protein BDB13_6088 [Rhodococcus sp. OK302]